MAEETGIEWCDSTWSAWIGCTKVSTAEQGGGACDNCYAEALNKRFSGGDNWGPGAPRRRTSDANWKLPASWNRNALSFGLAHAGRKRRVFLNNQADILDNEVDDSLRDEVFALIEATPNLEWLMLTKRIGNAKRMLPAPWLVPGGWPKNARLGITLCNQPETDRDLPKLLALDCPNFVSLEPLLGPIDLTRVVYPLFKQKDELDPYVAYDTLRGRMIGPDDVGLPKLDWVIVGGESGNKARPMHPQWARDIRDQCAAAGVPLLFKQWGEWGDPDSIEATGLAHHGWFEEDREDGGVPRHEWLGPMQNGVELRSLRPEVFRVGKKAAGRLLDGVAHDGYPEVRR